MQDKIIILFLLIITFETYAQPPIEWLHTYDDDQREMFADIYKISGEDYISCGTRRAVFTAGNPSTQMFLVRTENGGDVIWQNTYGEDEVYEDARDIIETDEGDFVAVGNSGYIINGLNLVLKVDSEGDQIWFRTYARGYSHAVIELKSGEYVIAGRSIGDGYLLCIDGDGEVIWQTTIEGREFHDLKETEDGIITAGTADQNIWVVKVDFDGDVIWSRQHQISRTQTIYSIVSSTEGGFALAGTIGDDPIDGVYPRDCLLAKIDDDGQLDWSRRYSFVQNDANYYEYFYGITRMVEGGYVLSGLSRTYEGFLPISLRVTSHGAEHWRRTFRFDQEDPPGSGSFSAVINGHDGSVYAAGMSLFDDDSTLQNGLIVKLEPEFFQPVIFHFEPQDTVFFVLVDDEVEFVVRARDQQGDELTNLWIMDEDTLGTDTTETITFEELGEYLVECQVSDGELTSVIRWHVTAEEFYIEDHSPDSMSLIVQRPYEVNFSLGIRSVEEIDPNYRWILTEPDGGEVDVGDEAEMTYEFDIRGDCGLEGRAYLDDVEHSVYWQITVNSVLHWWSPHERQFESEIRQQVEYYVLPFNEDSDSLEFRWLVDGEIIDEIEDGIVHAFDTLGIHTVTSIVHDGAEVDTVVWTVTVVESDGVNNGVDALFPTVVTLYPAAPNPFNSTTSIRYFLPRSADVRLTVYDSAGRFVQRLSDGLMMAGDHRVTLQGAELSAGVYLLRLEAGDMVRSLKVVLLN